MRSIQRRLQLGLLTGMAVLLAAVSIGVFYTVKHRRYAEVDEELDLARRVVYRLMQQGQLEDGAFLSMDARLDRSPRLRESERWREFDLEDGELVYQLRSASGEITHRSPSLGNRSLPPSSSPSPRQSRDVLASDATPFRVRVDLAPLPKTRSRGASSQESIHIVVAHDLTRLKKELSKVAAVTWGGSVVTLLAAAGFIHWLLSRGLRPLKELGERVSKVDASSLSMRFQTDALPLELQPIGSHLNGLMQRIESSFERERRFSSDLAHEIRTPLAEIMTVTESILRFPAKVSPDRFEDVLGSAKAMRKTIETLLSLSRWEARQEQLDREPVALRGLVQDCWETAAKEADAKSLQVKVTIPAAFQWTTNEDLLRHILANLFSNATEYTPEGGRIEITADEANGLRVRNTCQGLAEEDVAHLFERFWRSDASRTSASHSGLGLSIAKTCADMLDLNLEATLNGTDIEFQLSPK